MKTSTLIVALFLLQASAFGQSLCGSAQSLNEFQITAGNILPSADLDFIAYNPFNPNEAWASGKTSALIKLTRTGSSWTASQQITTFTQFPNQRFKYVQFLSPTTYLLAGDGIGNAVTDSGNVYISTNSGTIWNNVARVPGGPNYYVLRHPSFPNWYITGTRNGVFVSKNGGVSWVRQSNITPATNAIERYYAVVLDTGLSKVWITNRTGFIRSATFTDFSPAGNDNPVWTNEVTPTTQFGTITMGNASFNHISKSGSVLVAVSDNDGGAALIRSVNNGQAWSPVAINGYDPANNGELRWSSIQANGLAVVDDAGFVFYSGNILGSQPSFQRVQGNNGGDTVSTFTLNSIALRLSPDIQFLTAGNIRMGGGGPIMAHFECGMASGVKNLPSMVSFSLYPNPSQGQAWIEVPFEGAVEVVDALGKVQVSKAVQSGKQLLWDGVLAKGMYYIRYMYASGAQVVPLTVY